MSSASPDSSPLVSVIVPSFNQGAYIRQTLDSILAQDYRPLEIVVADGGSRDETVAILREYAARHPELRWISEPDNGPADAVNKGLRMAQGRYAAIQSSDDIYYPGALSAALRVLRAHADCELVYGDCDSFDNDGARSGPTQLPEFSWEAAFGRAWCYPQGSMVFGLETARAVGGWDARYYSCDLDFWMRLAFRTQPRKVDHLMYGWRRYPEQRTRSDRHQRIIDDYRRMIAESPEVRGAPARIRRLARASVQVLTVRFHPTGNLWSRRWHLLLATLLQPSHWRYTPAENTRQLIPGHAWAKALKRRLLGGAANA
ncbi:MAG TPA: glycosyltransferase family 2 protein [Solimonas sp.]